MSLDLTRTPLKVVNHYRADCDGLRIAKVSDLSRYKRHALTRKIRQTNDVIFSQKTVETREIYEAIGQRVEVTRRYTETMIKCPVDTIGALQHTLKSRFGHKSSSLPSVSSFIPEWLKENPNLPTLPRMFSLKTSPSSPSPARRILSLDRGTFDGKCRGSFKEGDRCFHPEREGGYCGLHQRQRY